MQARKDEILPWCIDEIVSGVVYDPKKTVSRYNLLFLLTVNLVTLVLLI